MMLTQQVGYSDYEELLSFENRVFNIDFLEKVPKLYADPARSTASHGVIRENGRIVAAVAVWPNVLETDCGNLRAVGIGSVGVDPEVRGKGYMKDMMAYCNRYAAEMQADLAYLSGKRGRYEHDGFRPCGSRFLFEVTPYFLQHYRGKADFVFVALDEDEDGADAAQKLHAARPMHWKRNAQDFLLFSHTWGAQSFSVRDRNGAFCGFMIVEGGRHVGDLELCDPAQAGDVLAAFSKQFDRESLTVSAGPEQTALLAALAGFGEQIRVEMPAAFKIYHFRRFIEALGSYKAKHFALPEGSLVLKIEEEVLRITVKDGRCSAEPTKEPPELCFGAKEAAVNLTTTFGRFVAHPLFAAWAPLCPLSLPHTDNV